MTLRPLTNELLNRLSLETSRLPNMNTIRFILLGCVAFIATPLLSQTATPASDSALPSAHLRQLIDATLPNMYNITGGKPLPIDRTTLMGVQVEYAAKAQTAPRAQQPMYRAALQVVANLAGALAEYEKAVSNYHYSQNLHGKSDRTDAKVSSSQRGSDVDAPARGNNAKQKEENDAEQQSLADKEQNTSNAVLGAWTRRIGQIQGIVQQSYAVELIAEKQLAMVAPVTPPPISIPQPVLKPVDTSTPLQNSPAGTWNGPKGTWTLADDGTIQLPDGAGSWRWADRTNRELLIHWRNDTYSKGVFSEDGKTLDLRLANGQAAKLTR